MLDPVALQRLYTSYGFETVPSEHNQISVFVYKKSRYFGVDIIPIERSEEILARAKKIKEVYSKTGYAANLKEIKNIDEAEIELFKSFFTYESTIQRIQKKYKDFTLKQKLSLIGNEYQYVESPFELHNHHHDESGIFEIITNRLKSAQPELVIIEAAAGYGKTCTAFEVLKKIVDRHIEQLPIFTELSRNRSANIFRYILLDEIDLEFPSLNSTLVIKEIKNGRIPLIIDGFDELLEKVDTEQIVENSFEDVESMLDTIGSLLEHKAKIVLTTRKTAIFTGLEFDEWQRKWSDKFNLTRIALKEPRIKDWIGEDRYQLVKEKNVPIQNIANPVLLTFLKNVPPAEFDSLISEPDLLVKEYFTRMLTRERDRQDLIMTVSSQLLVFQNVARQLLEMDSTVEEKEFFKLIILEDNKKILEETKSLYPSSSKRTVDNLIDSLSTHALLDRKGRGQNQIGFINDFVFGTFLGQILVNMTEGLQTKRYSSYMIELAVTAFRVQSSEMKEALWAKLQPVVSRFNIEKTFQFDIYLQERLVRDYNEVTLYDESFFNIKFSGHQIRSSVFLNCYFRNCEFDTTAFDGVSFISCTFSNCKVVNQIFIDDENSITAIKCKQENCKILQVPETPVYEEGTEIVTDLERQILEKLWSIAHSKRHHIVQLMNCFKDVSPRKVQSALKRLEEQDYLEIRGTHIQLSINKTATIKNILNL